MQFETFAHSNEISAARRPYGRQCALSVNTSAIENEIHVCLSIMLSRYKMVSAERIWRFI